MKLLVILGSTATGKTDLALRLAKKLNGELVACDSRQIYKKLDIGTGKLPGKEVEVKKGQRCWEMDGVKVWMYDVLDPGKQYTAFDYVKDANHVIDDISKRGKLPIIVGGVGLYLKALLEGLSNLSVPPNLKLRQKLENLSLNQLQEKVQKFSLIRWKNMNYSDRQNSRRLVRAIEIMQNAKCKMQNSKLQFKIQNYNLLKIGLMAPREILYKRIDERVISRINQGMIEEAGDLHENGLSIQRMKQLGLEYGVLADYLEDKIKNKEELIKVLQRKIHGYARRQITWFRREKNVSWFDITEKDYDAKLGKIVSRWYDNPVYATKN